MDVQLARAPLREIPLGVGVSKRIHRRSPVGLTCAADGARPTLLAFGAADGARLAECSRQWTLSLRPTPTRGSLALRTRDTIRAWMKRRISISRRTQRRASLTNALQLASSIGRRALIVTSEGERAGRCPFLFFRGPIHLGSCSPWAGGARGDRAKGGAGSRVWRRGWRSGGDPRRVWPRGVHGANSPAFAS